MDSTGGGDGVALEAALQAEGVSGRVEIRGRLAVLRPSATAPLDQRTRRRLVAIARHHGFTNLAIELTHADANIPRD